MKGKTSRLIRWIPPEDGWLKVSTDGTVNKVSGNALAGGLIRNQHGMWIAGFSRNIGCCSILDAKFEVH